jgi:flagellar biosynthetic protein FlhB
VIEKGNTPFSRELTTFSTLAAILLACWAVVPGLSGKSTAVLGHVLANSRNWPLDTPSDVTNLLGYVLRGAVWALAPFFLMLVIAAVAGSMVQNSPRFVLERVRPKLSRLSLSEGWHRLVGPQVLREFVKSVFKFSMAGIVCAVVFMSRDGIVLQSILTEAGRIPATALSLILNLLSWIVLAVAVLAAVDFLWGRRNWFVEQRMTRQEVKDEFKQSEGDPMVRMRIRSLARDRSRRRMIGEVANATLVIANPTHFAVAMRYTMEEGGAPRVVAKGQDLLALRIREVAEANGIPVFEDPPLARALYKAVDVDVEIPQEFYVPVAKIVRLLYAKEQTH